MGAFDRVATGRCVKRHWRVELFKLELVAPGSGKLILAEVEFEVGICRSDQSLELVFAASARGDVLAVASAMDEKGQWSVSDKPDRLRIALDEIVFSQHS